MSGCAIRYWLFLSAVAVSLHALICVAGEPNQPGLAVRQVLDLEGEGANEVAFSAATRELFVSHRAENHKLDQWNIATKKLVHAYSCPQPDARWDELAVSPDGKLLIASTYPLGVGNRKSQVVFIDTTTHQVKYTAEYDLLIREIQFDRSGQFIWITPTYPGPDRFVYDRDGAKHKDFKPKDFEPETRNRLWDVGQSKGGPPAGLFYRDTRGTVHQLTENPLNQNYALTEDGTYIGTSTWDQRVRVWRMSDLKEVFNEKMGAHPVRLIYDPKENQFLVLDGGNTFLRAVVLPPPAKKGKRDDVTEESQPPSSTTKQTSSATDSRP